MAEICEQINEYYNSMKMYARESFGSDIKTFMVTEKYQDNAVQMREFINIIEKNFKDVLLANRDLKYFPVKMLIAYHLSKYLPEKNETLVEIFSSYNF
jgi:hypothetical protein